MTNWKLLFPPTELFLYTNPSALANQPTSQLCSQIVFQFLFACNVVIHSAISLSIQLSIYLYLSIYPYFYIELRYLTMHLSFCVPSHYFPHSYFLFINLPTFFFT